MSEMPTSAVETSRLADGEADRRLDQAAGESLIDKEGETRRQGDVIRIGRARRDGIDARGGVVVPGSRAGQRAAGQHADGEHTHPLFGRPVDQPLVVLEGEVGGHRHSGGWIDQVVATLDRVGLAQPHGCVQGGRVSDAVDAPETRFALIP